ncbi:MULTISPECIES: GH32 C-terminal domain-containing protein [Prevotella]|uniref:GH32 C-terminal domain-containing protein n=1 Tax=Prevotella melaninogenica TaxID=28132 RepID=A0ABX7XPB3_9BACT|nr:MULTISPECIES: GH32 C-terminal domain-containing protein [Prevotella]QUB75426.1 GH32 C-terminal domain-containing protein [Prevotella melaninogenica]
MNRRNTILCATLTALSLSATAQTMKITRAGDTTIVKIEKSPQYLILPVEEEKDEAQVLLDNGKATDTWMDVRLAQGKTDYYVPFKLNKGRTSIVKILNLKADALALKKGQMKLSNVWDVTNTDFYRPSYHHTPSYGWMNDPNGMFYKDGVYHLCYQYNPYGSKWGNMHWGHAISRDLIHWKEVEPTIARDPMGHIFSGSAVIDKDGTANYGKDAIVALYTSASDKNGQIQCMAYSTDGGYTFHKYSGNPVLTPFDGLKDFRDPKVFWYAPLKKWYMIVSADKEMRFYSSPDLKKWTYVSAFGQGYGAQPNQFECPDFFQLPVDGNPNKKKWVMIVNINPGCLFGGSATEYFIGDFDGKNFVCDSKPSVAKFLDYGKDHYATVTFSGVQDRVLGIAWMSNWQYANVTPIRQYRGANTLPREFKLFTGKDGQIYMSSNVVPEVAGLRKTFKRLPDLVITQGKDSKNLSSSKENAFEIEMDVTPGEAAKTGFILYNEKGEKVNIYFDMKAGRLVMDRTESGKTKFGEKAEAHKIEKEFDLHEHREIKEPFRKLNSVNYKNDFALGTWAPLSLCDSKTYHLDVFVDKCSIEIFVNGGRIAMTNLVFPTQPYTSVKFYSDGNKAAYRNIKVSELKL